MPLFVRKIDQGKWLQGGDRVPAEIPADAITICLKTQSNTLSVWQIEDESQINEALLAILGNASKLEAIDVVILEPSELQNIQVKVTPGKTVEALKLIHRDLAELSYQKLGIIANCVKQHFENAKVKRYTKSILKDLLMEAITKQRIKIEELNQKVQEQLRT